MTAFENYQNGSVSSVETISGPGIDPLDFQDRARFHVMVYINKMRELDGVKRHRFSEKEVYVLWFTKVDENWKALISTSLQDDMRYEVTYNGARGFTYIDAYKKFDNIAIPD